MTENQTIRDRLISFIESQGISIRAFERTCGLSNGYVKNISKSVQPDKLGTIVEKFTALNPGWLMTGEGDMLRSEQPRQGQADPDDVEALRRRIAELEETVERQNRVIDALTGVKDSCNVKRIG